MARRSEIEVVGLREVGLLPMLRTDLADRRRGLEVPDEPGVRAPPGVGAVGRGQVVETP